MCCRKWITFFEDPAPSPQNISPKSPSRKNVPSLTSAEISYTWQRSHFVCVFGGGGVIKLSFLLVYVAEVVFMMLFTLKI